MTHHLNTVTYLVPGPLNYQPVQLLYDILTMFCSHNVGPFLWFLSGRALSCSQYLERKSSHFRRAQVLRALPLRDGPEGPGEGLRVGGSGPRGALLAPGCRVRDTPRACGQDSPTSWGLPAHRYHDAIHRPVSEILNKTKRLIDTTAALECAGDLLD